MPEGGAWLNLPDFLAEYRRVGAVGPPGEADHRRRLAGEIAKKLVNIRLLLGASRDAFRGLVDRPGNRRVWVFIFCSGCRSGDFPMIVRPIWKNSAPLAMIASPPKSHYGVIRFPFPENRATRK